MTKEQILNYFYTNSTNLGIQSILFALFGGLIVGLIIYLTYWINYKGVSYNRKFNLSLIILLEISVVIMLMISSNIVISLGMVGALSIVRFRTAIKDSRDTVFIFWAIVEGLSVGSQNFQLAITTTIFISLIMIVVEIIPKVFNKYLLIVRGDSNISLEKVLETIKIYTKDTKLRTSTKNKDHQEMILEIKTKGELNIDLVEKLAKIEGIDSINYIVETEGGNIG